MKYTYEDWLNVKVVLNTTKEVPNEFSANKVVSIHDFDSKDVIKIRDKQKLFFSEMLKKKYADVKNEFILKFEHSKAPKLLIERERESLIALIGGKFICGNEIYRSPIVGDNKTFFDWYYTSMMNHKNNSIVSGIVRDFTEIPSPNSCFYEKHGVPPEVMISVYFKMFRFVSKFNSFSRERNIPLNKPITTEAKSEEIIQTDSHIGITVVDNLQTKNNDDWNTFFKYRNEYDFFLMCKKELPNRGKKSKKMNDKSELTKYSNIFHFFMKKGLIRKGTKHSTFIEYLIEEHDAIFPEKTISIPAKYSEADRELIIVLFKIWQLEKQK
jgi:hypothetical protein